MIPINQKNIYKHPIINLLKKYTTEFYTQPKGYATIGLINFRFYPTLFSYIGV